MPQTISLHLSPVFERLHAIAKNRWFALPSQLPEPLHVAAAVFIHPSVRDHTLFACPTLSALEKAGKPWRTTAAALLGRGGSGGGTGPPDDKQTADDDQNKNRNSWGLKLLWLGAGFSALALLVEAVEDSRSGKEDTAHATVSIIIPALNEEARIGDTVSYIAAMDPPPAEIIVVDGGSQDRTVNVAREAGATVLVSGKGRGLQLNEGATAAQGELLCFVHADSQPPLDTVAQVRNTLADSRTVVGGFRAVIETDNGRQLRWMTFHQLIKTYYAPLLFRPLSFMRGLRCLFGDQSLFCRARDLAHVGGYDSRLPIMEDLDLVIRLHMAGPCTSLPSQSSDLSHSTAPLGSALSAAIGNAGGPGWATGKGRLGDALRPVTVDLSEAARAGGADEPGRIAGSTLKDPQSLIEWTAERTAQQRRSPRHAAQRSRSGSEERTQAVASERLPKPREDSMAQGSEIGPAAQVGMDKGGTRRQWWRTRGRIRFLWSPCRTSGRRLSAWGNVRGTYTHFLLATRWYFGASPEKMRDLYDRVYTDDHR